MDRIRKPSYRSAPLSLWAQRADRTLRLEHHGPGGANDNGRRALLELARRDSALALLYSTAGEALAVEQRRYCDLTDGMFLNRHRDLYRSKAADSPARGALVAVP